MDMSTLKIAKLSAPYMMGKLTHRVHMASERAFLSLSFLRKGEHTTGKLYMIGL